MKRRCLSILIYHRVLAQHDPLFPGEVDTRRFAHQLRLLKRFFSPLPLAEALQRLQDGTLPARAASITFDDGYADNAELALPLLRRYGLHATFFIATGYLDGGRMWNDQLIESVRHAGGKQLDLRQFGLARLPLASLAQRRSAIAYLLGQLKYLPCTQRAAVAESITQAIVQQTGTVQRQRNMQPPLMLSTAQLLQLQQAGMGIGAHTVNHPILATMSSQAAYGEMAQGKMALEQLLQAPVTLFAYPNGKSGCDYGAREMAMARSLGFTAALATDSGVARTDTDLFQLPRFTPWRPRSPGFLWQLWRNRRS